ncbi:hypothetical protein D3C76_1093410 [compost metagenome]
MTLQKVGERFDQFALQQLTETGQRQQTASLKAPGLGPQRLFGVARLGQRGAEQAFTGAVALQGIQDKRFFVRGWRFQRLEVHLQALAEEMPHRVAQEVVELGQAQGFIVKVRRQAGVTLLILLALLV